MRPEEQVKAMVEEVVARFISESLVTTIADYHEGWALGRLLGIQGMLDSGMTTISAAGHIECTKLIFKTRSEIRAAGGS